MKGKGTLKILLICLLVLRGLTVSAASDEVLISTETIDREVFSLEECELFSGIDPSELSLLRNDKKEIETSQYVEKQAENKYFENGFYEYSVREKKSFSLKREKNDYIRVKGTIKNYSTLERLAPRCPQSVLDLFNNKSGFRLQVDEDAEKTCRIDSKKKTVTIKKPTSQIYRALGSIYYKTARIDRSQSWKIKCGQEADQANASLSSFFASAFYEYCANPSKLQKKYPSAYIFLRNKFAE